MLKTGNNVSNYQYKYTDIDVDKIMTIRLEEENIEEYNIYLHAPVGESESKLSELLKEERKTHEAHPDRTLLLPFLNGHSKDGHWVGVVVRFQKKNPTKIEYYDSLDTEIPEKLKSQLKEAYGIHVNIDIERENSIKQDDSTSCGPCMIENLINAAKTDFSNKRTVNEIRKLHYELLQKREDSNLNSRGQYDIEHLRINAVEAKELNKMGNEYMSKNDFDKAIECYDEAIKDDPHYAIPHFNKRCAEKIKSSRNHKLNETQNSCELSAEYQAKSETYFVINTIFHAPLRSFSNDSSDEDISDNMMATITKTEKSNIFPYTKRIKVERKESKSKNEKITVQTKSICTNISTKCKHLNEFFHQLSSQGFDSSEIGKKSCIRACIALNRMRSVSQRKNNSLKMQVKSKIDTDIQHKIFGFFWLSNWYNRGTGAIVEYEEVKHFYKQLKRYNKLLAERFIEQEEDLFERKSENIPYRSLREKTKNHQYTKDYVDELRAINRHANIYLTLIDSDVVDFNGIFSAYLRIIQDCYEIPTVMSTGYIFPVDEEYGIALQFQSYVDRMIRIVTASHFPLGTYYPEPNMCIMIPTDCNTIIPESFKNLEISENNLESPMLLRDMQSKRPQATYIFSDDKPIITEIPFRIRKYKAPRAQTASNIPFSPEYISGHASPSKDDIKKSRLVSQSNLNPYKWYHNLLMNFNKNECFTNKTECVKIIAGMYKSSKEENMISLKNELSNYIRQPEIVNQIIKAINGRRKLDEYLQSIERSKGEQEVLDHLNERGINFNTVPKENILPFSDMKWLSPNEGVEYKNTIISKQIDFVKNTQGALDDDTIDDITEKLQKLRIQTKIEKN